MKTNTIKHEIVNVLPKTAEEWLKKNKNNRRLRPRAVEYYVRQISEGDWSLTGQPIVFDWHGNLLDGQHRLTACVKAGKPFSCLVVSGVDPKSFKHIDIGIPRAAADMADIQGYSYAVQKASAIRIYLMMLKTAEGDPITRLHDSAFYRPTMTEVLDSIKEHDAALELGCKIAYAQQARSVFRPPSLFIGLFLYLHEINALRARTFFEKLASGEDLPSTSPIWKLRERLIAENQITGAQGRRSSDWRAVAVLKGWNAWMRGETFSKIIVKDGEGFPRVEKRAAGGEVAVRKTKKSA